jgi:hypothetical protein
MPVMTRKEEEEIRGIIDKKYPDIQEKDIENIVPEEAKLYMDGKSIYLSEIEEDIYTLNVYNYITDYCHHRKDITLESRESMINYINDICEVVINETSQRNQSDEIKDMVKVFENFQEEVEGIESLNFREEIEVFMSFREILEEYSDIFEEEAEEMAKEFKEIFLSTKAKEPITNKKENKMENQSNKNVVEELDNFLETYKKDPSDKNYSAAKEKFLYWENKSLTKSEENELYEKADEAFNELSKAEQEGFISEGKGLFQYEWVKDRQFLISNYGDLLEEAKEDVQLAEGQVDYEAELSPEGQGRLAEEAYELEQRDKYLTSQAKRNIYNLFSDYGNNVRLSMFNPNDTTPITAEALKEIVEFEMVGVDKDDEEAVNRGISKIIRANPKDFEVGYTISGYIFEDGDAEAEYIELDSFDTLEESKSSADENVESGYLERVEIAVNEPFSDYMGDYGVVYFKDNKGKELKEEVLRKKTELTRLVSKLKGVKNISGQELNESIDDNSFNSDKLPKVVEQELEKVGFEIVRTLLDNSNDKEMVDLLGRIEVISTRVYNKINDNLQIAKGCKEIDRIELLGNLLLEQEATMIIKLKLISQILKEIDPKDGYQDLDRNKVNELVSLIKEEYPKECLMAQAKWLYDEGEIVLEPDSIINEKYPQTFVELNNLLKNQSVEVPDIFMDQVLRIVEEDEVKKKAKKSAQTSKSGIIAKPSSIKM